MLAEEKITKISSASPARSLVLAHGWNSTSFQIVNPGIERWFAPEGDAVIGYVTANKTRIVVGAPVCDAGRTRSVATAFEMEAAEAGERVCYFGAEERLESIYTDSPDHTRFLLGAQPSWNLADWDGIVARHGSLRAQLNRARNKGLTVSEWPITRAHRNSELENCSREWLASKGLPPLHFMVESDILARLDGRRVFVAELGGEIQGFVILSPVVRRHGWLFEQFPHRPGAPNGTVETMIDTAMRALASDGYHYATLGLSPLSMRVDAAKSGDPIWLRFLLAWMRKHGKRFYNFDGLDHFKAKLCPEKWEPVFAVSNESQVSFRTIYAITSAFSGSGPFRLLAGALTKAVRTELRWLKRRIF
ncbi:MAG: DUF2156 domain-containing protein [Acidobacteriota bacterium]